MVIERLTVDHFKAFDRFTVHFGKKTMLVGPNSAGKSTLIAALRAGASMLRHARARKPTMRNHDGSGWYRSYPLNSSTADLETENLRHEFHTELPTRLEIAFRGRKHLTAVWPSEPVDDDDGVADVPFFYLAQGLRGDRLEPQGPSEVRRMFPRVAVVPPIGPIELHERLLEEPYVRANLSGRLASRHFRNQLLMMHRGELGDWQDFVAYCNTWLPELLFEVPRVAFGETPEIDVFYREGRTPKEIAWAGDGYQVFLQMLLHVFRHQGADTIILDEPDLYLHADLQRRLVQVLDAAAPQVIVATHSSELLAEASTESITWVDKSRARAIRSRDPVTLDDLSTQIGTAFNLRFAKALRSKLVLFVEGKDAKLIRLLAQTIGAEKMAREQDLAVIPLEGFSNWRRVGAFGWLITNLLEGSIQGFVLLDRDYHTDETLTQIQGDLRQEGIRSHVWSRKELESYFLEPQAISRIAGVEPKWVVRTLDAAAEEMRYAVLSKLQATKIEERTDRAAHASGALEAVAAEFEAAWAEHPRRWFMCPARALLSAMNRELQRIERGIVTAERLARELKSHEIPAEMRDVILELEGMLSG